MDKYIIDECLGLDTLAERIVVREKDSNKTYLLSKMELMDMATTVVAYQEYLPLMKLSYENVALYFDIFTSFDHKISATFINLISEYFPMGNLDIYLQKLRNNKNALNNQLVDIWFAQILDGLMFLWNQNIVHRNLKPDCIYLRGENNEENCSLIIGDIIPLSVAYDLRMRTRLPRRLSIDESSCIKCHSALSYTAPEILESGQYTIQSDIYSLGCVLLDMITCDTLTDEETLQLRICARHDASTLSETLQNLQNVHETIPTLIGQMVVPNPEERLKEEDFLHDEYIIESMHNIDSSQMKYPSLSDKKQTRNDLVNNEKFEYYLNYLKQHHNAESRIEYAIQLCNQSKSIDLSSLAMCFQKDIIPIVEHFLSNLIIIENTLELLIKIIHNDTIITSQIVTFIRKIIPLYENNEDIIKKITDILIVLATQNEKLLNNARIASHLVQIMTKHEHNADISAKCCTLLWLMAKDSMTNELRDHQATILSILLKILQNHSDNSDLFTKVCFAFLPFVFEKSTVDYLVQFNLVRYFTIGLQKHNDNRQAIKAALAVLSELFKLDERCVMRFLCSRSNDGTLLDSMESLNKIFDRFKNYIDIARGILTLLKSMSSYDDAIDEMISTKIDENLLYEIKRFHSENDDIAQTCEHIMTCIRQRRAIS
ncbi:unnamed protein product [Rotaria sordida]|uniref:non-specific serine/threonine protein kinase n=1 Tax=Rotaria sordida TaxID=392033 RepID=A0A818V9H3_9BILA|nr:unnamed protein product [Rotaria sordida]CAF3703070.1 unnamed protein product [Rotaria sordida]